MPGCYHTPGSCRSVHNSGWIADACRNDADRPRRDGHSSGVPHRAPPSCAPRSARTSVPGCRACSGTGWFGAGREYVPMAALFVLIIGGADAEDYSLGYLIQMAVGLLVNLVVAPSSAPRWRRPGRPSTRLGRNGEELARTAEEVRAALAEADESRRGNPRAAAPPGLRARPPPPRDARRDPRPRPRPQRRPVGRSPTRSTATTPAPPPRTERSEAQRAVRHLVQVIDERTAATARTLGPDVLAAMHLRRVLVRLHHDGA